MRSVLRYELFELGIATHLKINLPETVCDLSVAWIQLARLLEISERSVPAILVPANHRVDQKGFGIIWRHAANDRQLITCPVVVSLSVNTNNRVSSEPVIPGER